MGLKIGFFVSDWNYEAIETFTEGVRRFLKEHQDVRAFLFNDFGIAGRHGQGRGEMNIFTLPDISWLDAIMVEGDRSWPETIQNAVIGKARSLGIPVASLNYPIEDCLYVGTGNYNALRDMTLHVIRDHGARRLCFVRGRKKSLEAQQREEGFTDACKECGILPEDISYYDADWYMEEGVRAARRMLKSGRPVPDAVICANDDLALGVSGVLKEAGIRIPEDVIVTGFDNLDIARFAEPSITTIERNYTETAYTGMRVLYDYLRGKKVRQKVYAPHKVVKRTSCGCQEEINDLREITGRYLRMSRHMRKLYQIETEMESVMYSADSVGDIMEMFEEISDIFLCRNIWLAVNTDYLRDYEKKIRNKPYSDRMALMAAWGEDSPEEPEDKANHIYSVFDKELLVPGEFQRENQFLVFYPLQSAESSIGYAVVDNTSPLAEFNVLQLVLQLFSNCIENVQRKRLMASLYRKVEEMSVRDSLTGLYNRFGLAQSGLDYAKMLYDKYGCVRLFFLDIDDMKKINDSLGHEAGDRVIRIMGNTIQDIGDRRDCFCMRYGGDEFLMIGSLTEDQMEEEIHKGLEGMEFPIEIRFSLGCYEPENFDARRIGDYIREADNKMYLVKREHHKESDS